MWVKEWGVTAQFALPQGDPTEVVFKASFLPIVSHAPLVYGLLADHCPRNVPSVLASEARRSATFALFRVFTGPEVGSLRSLAALTAIARTMARIQVVLAESVDPRKDLLPRTPVPAIPGFFEGLIQDIQRRYLAIWNANGGAMAKRFGVPTDLLERLTSFRRSVNQWANELAAGGWPETIDHVDLQETNAVVQPDGEILIYDWEEAVISSPFFSLDRLLEDARQFGEAGEWAVRDAYLATVPWNAPVDRRRAFDLAMCLGPIKTAHESKVFAEARGWKHGHPAMAARYLTRALPRWEAMEP